MKNIKFNKPEVTNYKLWQKTDQGWVLISGKGRRKRGGSGPKFTYIIHGVVYDSITDAMKGTGLSRAAIMYRSGVGKKPGYKKIRK